MTCVHMPNLSCHQQHSGPAVIRGKCRLRCCDCCFELLPFDEAGLVQGLAESYCSYELCFSVLICTDKCTFGKLNCQENLAHSKQGIVH